MEPYEIKNLLVPKWDDFKLSKDQRCQLITSLYRIYENKTEEFSTVKDCYLFNENEEWVRADALILTDSRFPDGFDGLGVEFSYPPQMSVKYPTFLEKEEFSNNYNIQDFLIKLGVNKYFKRKEVCFSDDKEYLRALHLNDEKFWNCRREEVRHLNKSKIAYLDNFFESKPTLNQIIELIFKSGYCDEVCAENGSLYWFYYSKKGPEKLKISYQCFCLRNIDAVKELRNYILDDNVWLSNVSHDPIYEVNDRRIQHLLLKLGARERLSDFTPDELYDAINRRTKRCEESNNYMGVSAFYDSVKKALSIQEADPIPSDRHIMMACKVGDTHQIKDSRDIYYSDSSSLPKKLLRTIPILELPGRAGEQKVRKFFGCKTFKDIRIVIKSVIENNVLTTNLAELLLRLKPFILAHLVYNTEKSDKKDFENKKKNVSGLNITAVTKLEYTTIFEQQSQSFTNWVEANESVLSEGKSFICSDITSVDKALEDVDFQKNIVEIICIRLNISYDMHSDFFFKLFKSNKNELQGIYIEDKFKAVWSKCANAFGVPVDELDFWSKVAKLRGWNFDVNIFKKVGAPYLKDFGIKSDVSTESEYKKWYLECLTRCRNKYIDEYSAKIHGEMVGEPREQEKYLEKVCGFQRDNWVEELMEKSKFFFRDDSEEYFDKIIRLEMAERFQFSPKHNGEISRPKKHLEYLEGIDESKLTKRQESLLYFEGNSDYFFRLRAEEDKHKPANVETEDIELSVCSLDNHPSVGEYEGRSNHEFIGNSRRVTEERKKELGDKAEDIVFKRMKESEDYYDIRPVSKHLDPENGDDSKGYDLSYRCKADDAMLSRLLEIKSPRGESFIISEREFSVAKENKSRYDIALVIDDKQIKIIKAAFLDESKYKIIVKDYRVYYSIKDNKQ